MKFFAITVTIQIAFSLPLCAQLQIQPGGSLLIKGEEIMVLHNISFENDGVFYPGKGTVIFSGDAPSNETLITGSGVHKFFNLIIAKQFNNVMLKSNISVDSILEFYAGNLDIGEFDVDLGTTGIIAAEKDSSRVVSESTGVVRSVQEIVDSTLINFGNLGLRVASANYLGWSTVERGHEPLPIGDGETIDHYFKFKPGIDQGLGMIYEVKYLDAHLENQAENDLKLFQKIGSNWFLSNPQSSDTPANTFLCEATATESYISLAAIRAGDACDTGLDINNLFGTTIGAPVVSVPYDNTDTNANGDPSVDLATCFFQSDPLQHSIWYTFTGNGNRYRIRTVPGAATNYIQNGDTQAALFSGACVSPVFVVCNDDETGNLLNINFEVTTVAGQEYRLLLDGYDGAQGQFCLEVTRIGNVNATEISNTPIRMAPNPTTGIVQLSNVTAEEIQVFDCMGRMVQHLTQPGNTIDLSSQPTGLYLLQLREQGKWYTARVLKQ